MSKPFNDGPENRTADGEANETSTPADSSAPGDPGLESVARSTETLEANETLQAQLETKDREIAELNDKYLRALAEQENARKRIRQQAEESIRHQRESLLRDLLPIVDNLELAVAAARAGGNGESHESIIAGIEMVLRSMHDLLRGHGVTPQEAVGRSFNPQFHEAVDHLESPEHKPNTIVREYHRGYQIGDRVLRPARVAVAKAPSEHLKAHQGKAHDDAPRQHRHREDGGAGKSGPGDVENE
ncbi:MAG: nucleotide exchange factor GrpE [Candidatus Binatales bacterium]